MGADALAASSSTHNNTAVGYAALSSALTNASSDNVAIGYRSMALANSYSSVAINSEAILLDQGQLNVAVGKESLTTNTSGESNTAVGWRSLFNNNKGNANTVQGVQAMFFNESGNENVAIGNFALGNNISGSNNIASSISAGRFLTTGSNNVDIGARGVADESNTIRLSKRRIQTATSIAGIYGVTVPSGLGVIVDSHGHLATTTSSARFKENIKPMDKASEAILSLQPVSFRYKKELDPKAIPQFGLVAEQVEKVAPDLVVRDDQGKPYSVRYEAVSAMLLNEFLKEHRKVEKQDRKVEQLVTCIRNSYSIYRAQRGGGWVARASRVLANGVSPSRTLIAIPVTDTIH